MQALHASSTNQPDRLLQYSFYPYSYPMPLCHSLTPTTASNSGKLKAQQYPSQSRNRKLEQAVDSILKDHHQGKTQNRASVRQRLGPPTERDSFSTVSTGPGERAILNNTRIQVTTCTDSTRGGGRTIPIEIIVYTTGSAATEKSNKVASQQSFHLLQKPRTLLPGSRNIMEAYDEDDAEIIFAPSFQTESPTSSMETQQLHARHRGNKDNNKNIAAPHLPSPRVPSGGPFHGKTKRASFFRRVEI